MFDPKTQKNLDQWFADDYDEASKTEIRRLQKENPLQLLDAFYTHLDFGTGGLRGMMGVGTNRINRYTIRSATQGLANYIATLPIGEKKHSIIIGFDSRHSSKEFAGEAAKVLAANDIEVFLYNELRPMPLLAFGLLHKKCIAGIMITASHNPSSYNGYKVYWSHGGQVLPPHDRKIVEEVNKISSLSHVRSVPLSHPLVHEIFDEIDPIYLKAIDPLQLYPKDNKERGGELHVVYTSLHGAGITMVPLALANWGFTNSTIVSSQEKPDGDFPTVLSPNPEEHEALAIGVEKLQEVGGDLLLATDPDTDRLGVVVMDRGKPYFFDGNQIACLLLYHICSSLQKTDSLPLRPTFIKTIVTSELFRKIVEDHKGTCIDVLTGFKYIGEKIAQWEKDSSTPHFVFGGEESYGYLLGTHVRDKDAIVSAVSLCEAALQMKIQGKTLVDLLYEIYEKYGVYRGKLISIDCKGKEGADRMEEMMDSLRAYPPRTLTGIPVVKFEDYLTSSCLVGDEEEFMALPKSNVLRIWLSDKTKIVIRPSGTEPKIKLYGEMVDEKSHVGRSEIEQALRASDLRLDSILTTMKVRLLQGSACK